MSTRSWWGCKYHIRPRSRALKVRHNSAIILIAILLSLARVTIADAALGIGPNLIPNSEFAGPLTEAGLPRGWQRPFPGPHVFLLQVGSHPEKFIALMGGQGRGGQIWCELAGIRPHTTYYLEFDAFRPQFTNGAYLELEVFGQRFLVNQHCTTGRVQHIFLTINSGSTHGKARLLVSNPHIDLLAFGAPSLRIIEASTVKKGAELPGSLPNFFPVGVFNAVLGDLQDTRAVGFNAVQSYATNPDSIRGLAEVASRLGLKYLVDFRSYKPELSRYLGGRREILGFYIEDEPELRSISPESLTVLAAELKRDHPGVLTAVAMVRPQMVKEYRESVDVFLLDPYPVPNMPLTWLSDALEEAARYVARERLWAVIQAFGEEKHRQYGWPRPPTPQEMRCLTYLAVAHGAHGIFYFSYPDVRFDPTWEGLKVIVGELKRLQPWLMAPNESADLQVEMISPYKADAEGRPAVHWAVKRRDRESLLILVNAIEHPVKFYIHGFSPQVPWLTEIFQQRRSVVLDGNIREELEPYEVRLYHYQSGE
jgi:hypothetical protein